MRCISLFRIMRLFISRVSFLVTSVLDKSGEELSFKKYRAALVVHQKRVRTLFDEVLANKAKRIKIKVSFSN